MGQQSHIGQAANAQVIAKPAASRRHATGRGRSCNQSTAINAPSRPRTTSSNSPERLLNVWPTSAATAKTTARLNANQILRPTIRQKHTVTRAKRGTCTASRSLETQALRFCFGSGASRPATARPRQTMANPKVVLGHTSFTYSFTARRGTRSSANVLSRDGNQVNHGQVPGHRPTCYPGMGIRQPMGSVNHEAECGSLSSPKTKPYGRFSSYSPTTQVDLGPGARP